MNKSVFLISGIFLLNSCISQKNPKEFIQLYHNNIMVVAGDKLTITLIPTKKKRERSVIVRVLRKNEIYDTRRISLSEYKKIQNLIMETKQQDIEVPQSPNKLVVIIDGGSNSIFLKKDIIEKKLYTQGLSKEYHGNFYKAVELILKTAKYNIREIN